MILNYGSLNIDHVYHVPHFVKPGETLGSTDYDVFAGGKGANQSVALARAGAAVRHAGKLGNDGGWLKDLLAAAGVDVAAVQLIDGPSGHAVIQVNAEGENSIILFGGANQQIDDAHVARAFAGCGAGDTLLLQNEINLDIVPEILHRADDLKMNVVLNPAPMTDGIQKLDFGCLSMLVVNEVEARQLTQEQSLEDILAAFAARWPELDIVLTQGADGVCYAGREGQVHVEALAVEAVDTTAAGDTFIGYLLAERDRGSRIRACLETAAAAAAISVTRPGAMPSIPVRDEVLEAMQ